MDNTQSRNETLVFGLDIGTRSIVGCGIHGKEPF